MMDEMTRLRESIPLTDEELFKCMSKNHLIFTIENTEKLILRIPYETLKEVAADFGGYMTVEQRIRRINQLLTDLSNENVAICDGSTDYLLLSCYSSEDEKTLFLDIQERDCLGNL